MTLTHPEKLLWPKAGVTKQGLLGALRSRLATHAAFCCRPAAEPGAGAGWRRRAALFQKHASKGMHEAIRRMKDPEDGEELAVHQRFRGPCPRWCSSAWSRCISGA